LKKKIKHAYISVLASWEKPHLQSCNIDMYGLWMERVGFSRPSGGRWLVGMVLHMDDIAYWETSCDFFFYLILQNPVSLNFYHQTPPPGLYTMASRSAQATATSKKRKNVDREEAEQDSAGGAGALTTSSSKPYKSKVLILCSRGITYRMRHLMNDLANLITHGKKGQPLSLFFLRSPIRDLCNQTERASCFG
jgi:hypothetical protein